MVVDDDRHGFLVLIFFGFFFSDVILLPLEFIIATNCSSWSSCCFIAPPTTFSSSDTAISGSKFGTTGPWDDDEEKEEPNDKPMEDDPDEIRFVLSTIGEGNVVVVGVGDMEIEFFRVFKSNGVGFVSWDPAFVVGSSWMSFSILEEDGEDDAVNLPIVIAIMLGTWITGVFIVVKSVMMKTKMSRRKNYDCNNKARQCFVSWFSQTVSIKPVFGVAFARGSIY